MEDIEEDIVTIDLQKLVKNVKYSGEEYDNYEPSLFAHEFVNFIKSVNADKGGEENKTPVMHYRLLDNLEATLASDDKEMLNMVFRGAAKLQSGSSKILTPAGWTTMLKIQKGDELLTRHGEITKVIYKTSPQYPQMFNMYLNDGTKIEVGDEHNHIIYDNKTKKEYVFTTLELLKQKYNKFTIPLINKLTFIPTPKSKSNSIKYLKTFSEKTVFISKSIFVSEINDRLFVLRKMMDFHGYIENKKAYFSCKSSKLLFNFQELIQTLGGYTLIKGKVAEIFLPSEINPFDESNNNYSSYLAPKKLERFITKIEECECVEAGFCIKVEDETESYITDGYTITHNTTLFAEYLFLYIALTGGLPHFDDITVAIYVADSMDNGAKKLRGNLESRFRNSSFLKDYIPEEKCHFTDSYIRFENVNGKRLHIDLFGVKALSLDSILYMDDKTTTMGKCKVGEYIYAPNGKQYEITAKSEVFHNKNMYKLILEDGRELKVSEDHINAMTVVEDKKGRVPRVIYKDINVTTKELLGMKLRNTKRKLVYIRNTKPVEYSEKDLPIPPYLLGLLIAGGNLVKGKSNRIGGLREDIDFYLSQLEKYNLDIYSVEYVDERYPETKMKRFNPRGLTEVVDNLGLADTKANNKFIPSMYMFGSIEQRTELLQGLMDADGTIGKTSRMGYSTISKQLAIEITRLIRSLGMLGSISESKNRKGNRQNLFRVYLRGTINPFKLKRKRDLFKVPERYKGMAAVTSIEKIQTEDCQCISINSPDNLYLTEEYVGTHNTGVRGVKHDARRVDLIIADDLLSDKNANSPTIINDINDVIDKAISHAVNPNKYAFIWSGTPFNKRDPLYTSVESGAYKVNAYPVCEKFPCKKEEFKSAWGDRFTFEYVNGKYKKLKAKGNLGAFYQEMMLQVMSDDVRLIEDHQLKWFNREILMARKSQYNFYITTDLATSVSADADYRSMIVWAYSSDRNWYAVEGVLNQKPLKDNIDILLALGAKYKPLGVGVEVTGQQEGFIGWIEERMLLHNTYFPLVSEGNSKRPGIRPTQKKFERFYVMVPQFHLGKIFLPKDLKETEWMKELVEEVTMCSHTKFQSKHDDMVDCVSMLQFMNPFVPSNKMPYTDHTMKKLPNEIRPLSNYNNLDNFDILPNRSNYCC